MSTDTSAAQVNMTQAQHPAERHPEPSVEHRALQAMLVSYCQREHACRHRGNRLCIGCLELYSFIDQKLPHCSRGPDKAPCTACQNCCMPAGMLRKLQQITRSELLRISLHRPLLALRYRNWARRQLRGSQ